MSGAAATRTLKQLAALLESYGAEANPTDAKGKTRARILRTATELFQRQGYKRTSVDDVARESGVAKGTVYVHFKNKAELLFHAIAEEKKRFMASFLPIMTEALAPDERMRRYLALSFSTLDTAPLISKLMSGDREMLLFLEELGPELSAEVSEQQMVGMTALLEGVGHFDRLTPAQKRDRIAVLKGVVYSAAQLMDERTRGELSKEKFARELARMIVAGLGAPPP